MFLSCIPIDVVEKMVPHMPGNQRDHAANLATLKIAQVYPLDGYGFAAACLGTKGLQLCRFYRLLEEFPRFHRTKQILKRPLGNINGWVEPM